MFKPLIRTIPTLSGNFTLACHVKEPTRDEKNQDVFNVLVRNASFIPLQNKLYDKIINANLNSGKYEFEITKYYKYYSNYFYNTNFKFNDDDYQILNKYSREPIEQRNRDYEFGCKRMQKTENDFQFMFYAPFYIDCTEDIPDCFKIFIKFNETTTKTISISLNKDTLNQNLLYQYLTRYVEKIDDNVVYCMHDTCQAMYDGVDVKLGGLVRLKDNNIGSIYVLQQTMNNFDYTICDGFARNNIVMKQIIPLSFMFNVDDILTTRERKYFTNYPVQISGMYYKNNAQIKFYDFSIDYVDYHLRVKTFDTDTNYTMKCTDNLMNCDYPALHEGFYYKYKYTNKFTPQYCRWKLKYTDDNEPYITNMNYAFSYMYSDKNNQYGDFPNIYVKKPKMHVENMDVKRPVGNELKYYTTSLNNNTCDWFTTVSEFKDILDKQSIWKDVRDDKVYYNGILYDLNKYLSSKRSSNIHRVSQTTDITYSNNILYNIDKFGVFIQPHAINVSEEEENNYKLVENVITLKTSYSAINCRVYDDFIERGQIFAHTTYQSQPALYENDVLLKKNSYGNYEIIKDYFSYDTWYNYNDIKNDENITVDRSYIVSNYELLPFDSSNCFYYTDDETNSTMNILQDSDSTLNLQQSLYVSDKYTSQKTLIAKDKIHENMDDYRYFVKREFVNKTHITVDGDDTLAKYTKYNYVPMYKNDDDVNEDYMKFSKENKIYMNEGYFAYNVNQIYVDEYNLNKFSEYLNTDISEVSYIIAYGEPISLQHVIEYADELSKDNKYVDTTTFDELLDNIYVRESYMNRRDDTLTIEILYEYQPLRELFNTDMIRDEQYSNFIKILEYDENTHTFSFYGYNNKKLFFKRKYYTLTKELFNKSIIKNEPLMLYVVNSEHPDEKIDHEYDDDKNLQHTFRGCLVPLIHHVKKIDTFEEYDALVKSKTIHTYENNENCMVYSDIDENAAICIVKDDKQTEQDFTDNKDRYEIINRVNIKYTYVTKNINRIEGIDIVDDVDKVVRGGENNLLYCDEKNNLYVMRYCGKNYMFYYMNVDYLCTNYSFNMDGFKFTSVYGNTLDNDDTKLFDIITPYFKESIFNKFTQNVNMMMIPSEFKIPIHYVASLYDDGNTTESYKYEYLHDCSTNVYDIKYVKKINKKILFRRYFDNITPLIQEYKKTKVYHLYFKNIDMYINENNLYRQPINMYDYSPIKCLMRYDDKSDIPLEEMFDDIYEYEYKHFNDNLMWNLIPYFEICHENKTLTYEQLLDAETENNTFYYFKKYILNNSHYTFDESEINDIMLFLFNKYTVNYISEPLKLNVFKNKRQYTLIYKFILM